MSRESWLKVLRDSVALLVPCFWHQALVAGDVGSHLYNTWLVQLSKSGHATGLWISAQWTNVLFDWMLEACASFLPIHLAGKLAVYLMALVFFWGSFSFVSVASGRLAWVVSPVLAMVTFGWIFQSGYCNYYLSLGLAFAGISFFWSQRGGWRILPLALSPIIAVAHPFGFAWFAGAVAYITIAEVLPRRFYFWSAAASIGILAAAGWYLRHRYRVEPPAYSVGFCNGIDQIVLTKLYLVPAAALALFAIISIGCDLMDRRKEEGFLPRFLILLQLYVIVEACILLLPDVIHSPQITAPLTGIAARTTAISAVLLCGLIACTRQRKWHFPALLGTTLVFFALLYYDTGKLSRMEEEAQQLVQAVPVGQRILFTVHQPSKYRFSSLHIVDDACIGHCFSYGNYEAATNAFRIRALKGNGIVMSKFEQTSAMELGEYVVQPEDLPAQQIYQCGSRWTDLCIHSLRAGEKNNDPLDVRSEIHN